MHFRNFLLLSLVTIALINEANAKQEWGLCPQVSPNYDIQQKGLNITKLMGIWYEYLVTPELKEGHAYDCASWLMMQDNKNDSVFSVIYNQMKQNSNDTRIRSFEMDCTPTTYYTNTAVCYYQVDQPKNLIENYSSHRTRSFRIVYTDYYSYLIAKVCQSYGLFYYQDYIVLTRDKTPSIYHRKQMKEKLAEIGLTSQDFDKGRSFECWGEDYWN